MDSCCTDDLVHHLVDAAKNVQSLTEQLQNIAPFLPVTGLNVFYNDIITTGNDRGH